MSNLDYWTRRAIHQEAFVNQGLNLHHPVVARAYNRAQNYLTRRVLDIFTRYADETGFTETEMERILNSRIGPRELAELRRLATEIDDRDIRRQAQNYLNVLAARHRITRLESLRATAYLVARQVSDVELRTGTGFLIDTIYEAHRQAAAEAIIRSTEEVFDIYNRGHLPKVNEDRQIEIIDLNTKQVVHRINIEQDTEIPRFRELNTRRVRTILNTNWVADGNFSSRVWNNSEILAKRLQELFTVEAFTGMSEREMAEEIANEFRIGQNVAKRLIRTESSYVHSRTKLDSWREHGVEQFKVVAVLDLRTSKICRKMDGQIFKVAEAVPGVNMNPFHPFCRTTVVSHFGERTLRGTRNARDPFTGQSFEIRRRDTYQDWEHIVAERNSDRNLELEHKKIMRYKTDRDQWRRHRGRGVQGMEHDFEKWQHIKYYEPERYEEWVEEYRRLGVEKKAKS